MRQVHDLIALKDFTDNPANNPRGVRFRNVSDRRKFVKETLGLKVVKHPKTGLDCVPVLEKTLMLTGHRKTATREKREEHEDKCSAKESFKKMRKDYEVSTNKFVPRRFRIESELEPHDSGSSDFLPPQT